MLQLTFKIIVEGTRPGGHFGSAHVDLKHRHMETADHMEYTEICTDGFNTHFSSWDESLQHDKPVL